MSTHNICLYKEVDIKYTGCNLKTMELLDCALIGVCAVIRSNTVVWYVDFDQGGQEDFLVQGHRSYFSDPGFSHPPSTNQVSFFLLTLLMLNTTCSVLANSVDPDHLASEEANWSGSALFIINNVNFYQKPESSNLIGWKLEVGMAS